MWSCDGFSPFSWYCVGNMVQNDNFDSVFWNIFCAYHIYGRRHSIIFFLNNTCKFNEISNKNELKKVSESRPYRFDNCLNQIEKQKSCTKYTLRYTTIAFFIPLCPHLPRQYFNSKYFDSHLSYIRYPPFPNLTEKPLEFPRSQR